MADQSVEDTKKEIREILRAISEAWRNGDIEKLGKYFDDDMVITHPGFSKTEDGRDVCVDSYKQFINRVMIRKYEEDDHHVHVWGDTAVAHYHYKMEYAVGGDDVFESGHDLLVFVKRGENWVAVWRTMVPVSPDAKVQ